MPKISLTPEEKERLIEAVNNDLEPTPDLLPKLFPGTAEKFDVQALDRAKVPTLEYAGRRSKAAILAEAGAGIGAAPLQVVRSFGNANEDEWRNLIVQGDNLQFLKTCYKNEDPIIKNKVKGLVKVIYIDPPFATKSEFGSSEGERSYTDKIDMAEYIESLRERLLYMSELLSPNGIIYVHLDQKMSHYIKVIMDGVFGKENFRNEIIWRYRRWPANSKDFQKMHDTIFRYSKENKGWSWTQLYENKSASTLKAFGNAKLTTEITERGTVKKIKTDEISKGTNMSDVWEIPMIQGSASTERSASGNYPTQKPEELIERIINSSSEKGDLIIDFFGGSGTTASVAEKLGRRWIMCDFGKHAIYTMQRRMLNIGRSKALNNEQDDVGKIVINIGDPYRRDPKPFSVISAGAYDFSHIMDLRKEKDTYITFVLGLFQLAHDAEKATKYMLPNIYAVKNNHPVEVYPIWDDQFLREVKIDESYLRGIITQSGGKLRGEYYIITPESCTNIGDTTLKNQEGKEIQFHMLTFPYKMLEDVSRNLVLTEQPSSQANVNNLITSTAFYFNDQVDFAAKSITDGFKITRFETKILNSEGKRFENFTGIAMVLVDLNYDAGKPFDMDKTIFANEIAEDGIVKVEGLTNKVGLIVIDKHGNETKPYNLE